MKPSEALSQHREELKAIIAKYPVQNPRIFGSVLHGNDTEESDLDILVDGTKSTSYFNIAALELEIIDLIELEVDVITADELSPRVREKVLREAVTL